MEGGGEQGQSGGGGGVASAFITRLHGEQSDNAGFDGEKREVG